MAMTFKDYMNMSLKAADADAEAARIRATTIRELIDNMPETMGTVDMEVVEGYTIGVHSKFPPGQRIDLIKHLRSKFPGLTLKEAKDMADKWHIT